ncbi:MAG: MBL fold metallo-hydrolase [Woeseiaceae bacterium]
MVHRRRFLSSAAGCALAVIARPAIAFADDKPGSTRLILLGTKGGPTVVGEGRRNPSTLLLINGTPYVVDCGYGTSRQLLAAGVPLGSLRYVFITHHHSDHNLDYGPTIYNAWIRGMTRRLDAYGPPGLEQMTRDFFQYMKFDIETRIADEGRTDLRELVFAHDFHGPGIVMQNDAVKVTAARVRHPPIEHAFAFRFDTRDRSVVISGDTTYSPELVELAKGADVLVHEVLYLPGVEAMLRTTSGDVDKLRQHMLASHTVSEDVGRVATRAGVRTLVLSHFVPGAEEPVITDEQWIEGVRKHFSGRIVVGKDLMEIQP